MVYESDGARLLHGDGLVPLPVPGRQSCPGLGQSQQGNEHATHVLVAPSVPSFCEEEG